MICPRLLVLILLAVSLPAFAQQQTPETPSKPAGPSDLGVRVEKNPAAGQQPVAASVPEHRFWDKTNVLLFAGVTGARYFDYGSTIWMRHRGVDEWLLTNDIVDNHAAFAAIEFAGAAASVGISYAFHKTGHHKLERWTSVVHIGVATGGAIRNFTLP